MGICSVPKSRPIIYQFIVPPIRKKPSCNSNESCTCYTTHFILTGRAHRAPCTDTASSPPSNTNTSTSSSSTVTTQSSRGFVQVCKERRRSVHEAWPALSSSFKDHNHGDWIWKIRLVTNQVLFRHSPAYLASLMSPALLFSDTLRGSCGLLVHPAKPLYFCLFIMIYLFVKGFHLIFMIQPLSVHFIDCC